MNIVGIDIGGTFTDLVGIIDGEVVTSKTSTVPADPTAGVAESLRLANCDPRKLAEVLHGSTIAINTVLERKGAQTALLTTAGFRDVYAIGRSNRIEAFNLFFHRPKPLTPRRMTFEVDERLDAAGEVIRPLDAQQVAAIARELHEAGVEAVAVCFLHSYANPAHERLAGAVLREINPSMFVTLSHEILREFREYERTSTTVLNAYVGPRVRNYLGTLETYLRREDFAGKVQMMRSNGGVMSIRKAQEEPVSMMESGPVAGMIGAGRLARASRHRPRHRLRHGRHHRQGEPDHRRHARDRGGLCDRHAGERPADAAAGGRHRRGRRRRRLDRLGRPDRRAACRPEKRRRRSGARLLRQGVAGSRGDRRRPGARPAQPGPLSQWRHEARYRGGATGGARQGRQAARTLDRGSGARHRDDRRQRDVACGARGVGEQGRRSARDDADRVRRRRPRCMR